MKPAIRPLGYCTNVHPANTLAQVVGGLDQYAVRVARNLGRPMAVGLWFSQEVAQEILLQDDGPQRLAGELQCRELSCYTLNAFPYGDFHGPRVKQNVYLPDWSEPPRLAYTQACADILVALLGADGEGSISTLPLGFKRAHAPDFWDAAADHLIQCARHLDHLYHTTGKLLRLAIEPEPLCELETTPEAISFFQQLWQRAGRVDAERLVRTHLGLCYDVCHQAVEFEDTQESIVALDHAGVRINKVQLSCAVQVDHPGTNAAARAALMPYVEPRYLHQTVARDAAGALHRAADLTESLITAAPEPFASAPIWRIHFHVPIHARCLGLLSTTRNELPRALSAIAKLDYRPDVEIETYTWNILPDFDGDLVEGLSRELRSADEMLGAAHQTA